MRDLILTLLVVGSLPYAFKRPWIGLVVWAWLGYMNPHRLTWGFAYDMPFVQMVALVTLAGMVFDKEKKRIPWSSLVFVWLAWIVWTCFTALFALNPVDSALEMERVLKIQLMILVTMMVINSRERIDILVWVMAFSIGFFGIKGGLFTAATGGSYRVWGPPGSFVEGNNEIALALIVVIPLMRYLQLQQQRKWIRLGIGVSMALCALAALGSYSRGALVAIAAMTGFLWLKSRHKFAFGVPLVAAVVLGLAFMPEAWFDRMNTIGEYNQDNSALGRINAWHFAANLAADHPFVGGGFDSFSPDLFRIYAPDPTNFHDSHSIYFQVLGNHGYVGLLLYVSLALTAFFTGSRILRMTRDRPELKWARDLASMLQVSLIGFGVGGAFLGLAYWDLPYQVMATMAVTAGIVRAQIAGATRPNERKAAAQRVPLRSSTRPTA